MSRRNRIPGRQSQGNQQTPGEGRAQGIQRQTPRGEPDPAQARTGNARPAGGLTAEDQQAVDQAVRHRMDMARMRMQRAQQGPATMPGAGPAPMQAPGSMPGPAPMMGMPGQIPGAGLGGEDRAAAATGQAQPEDQVMLPSASRVTEERLIQAERTLMDYKQGKASVERRIIASQQWWKLKQWKELAKEGIKGADEHKSETAWLWNCIVGKHADHMDNYPEPVVLPRVEDDKEEAKRLSDILPVILESNGFEETFSQCGWQKFIEGTGAYGVFWDKELNGLGDISIKKVNLLNLFWEPGVNDIQDSRNLYHVALMDIDLLHEVYPQTQDIRTQAGAFNLSHYVYDDTVDTKKKALVIDWYYHKYDTGKKVLHLTKFVGHTVLYSTEDDPKLAERGLYDDGEYPFVLDVLYPVEGTPTGYGIIDIGRDTQKDIDSISQAIVLNAMVNAAPRYFMRSDGGINEKEFADFSKPIIHVQGNLQDDSVKPLQTPQIPTNAMNLLTHKIDEIKWITGNVDVANGATPSGVTAASAIAALREESGRSSKDSTRTCYRAYARIIKMCIERIRQFYDMPRQFRILGKRGQERFIKYTNERLVAQSQGQDFGVDMGYRVPAFDISVHAQRETSYGKASTNELALQLYHDGFFNPQMAQQASMCLDMMDFRGVEELQEKIAENGTLQDMCMQLLSIAQQMAQAMGDAQAMASLDQIGMAMGMQPAQAQQAPARNPGKISSGESALGDPTSESQKRSNTILGKAASQYANASRVD